MRRATGASITTMMARVSTALPRGSKSAGSGGTRTTCAVIGGSAREWAWVRCPGAVRRVDSEVGVEKDCLDVMMACGWLLSPSSRRSQRKTRLALCAFRVSSALRGEAISNSEQAGIVGFGPGYRHARRGAVPRLALQSSTHCSGVGVPPVSPHKHASAGQDGRKDDAVL